jgi:hypothetical protein
VLTNLSKTSHKVGADNGRKLGWEPKWTQEMYLNSLDDEVQATLDFDMKPTIFDDLLAQQKA